MSIHGITQYAGRRPGKRHRAFRRRPGAPLQQGQLDGLCGIYSAINALSLLAERGRPFPLTAATALYRDAIELVAARGALSGVTTYGLDTPLWLAVIRRLARRVEADQSITLAISRPFQHRPKAGFGRLRRAIEAALDQDAIVLVSLTGAHSHYTVIRTYTASRFMLHDSSGLRWLSIAACGTSYSRQRHQIAASWLIVIKVTGA